MATPMKLDEFLESQSSGFTATLEPIPDKPTAVRVTPYREDRGCGCSSSFELPKDMVRSVVPTGKYHYCCGKRLEVVVVEFTEAAAVPVAELMKRAERPGEHAHAPPPYPPPQGADNRGGASPLVGRWPVPGLPCELACIEVCTRFCHPTGWDCCRWETRCALNCRGLSFPVWPPPFWPF
jgi:hypothetical protein